MPGEAQPGEAQPAVVRSDVVQPGVAMSGSADFAAPQKRMQWVAVAIGLLFALYPLLVWVGLANQSPRSVAIGLLLVMVPVLWHLVRRAGPKTAMSLLLAPALTVAAVAGSALFDDAAWLFAEPVVISLVLLLVFGVTLRRGARPMIERFARLQEPDLTPPKQAWCRLWTWIWCGFFVVNAASSWLLSALAPMAWWVFYTTTLAYVLMGVLFASEWLLRRRRFAHG